MIWCSFGFKFHDRLGHFTGKSQNVDSKSSSGKGNLKQQDEGGKAKEVSPVFLQWLDVVAQLLQQFPNAFEFNEEMLVFVADHAFSGLFGTFFFNTKQILDT